MVTKRKPAARSVQDDVLARRRQNLRTLAAQRDGVTGLAKRLGYSGPSYLSQMIGPQHNRPISERTARHIEAELDLPAGWLDQDHGHFAGEVKVEEAPLVAVPIDEPLFLQVADVLRPLLVAHPLTRDKAHMVFARVYADAEKRGQVDAELARDLVRLAA